MTTKDLAVLSAMITPAVLIMANSSLILATSQRLSRIMERARRMNDHMKPQSLESDSMTPLETDVYEILDYTLERGLLLQKALSSLYVSLVSFVATSASIGVIDITRIGQVWLPVTFSVVGVGLLLFASLLLMRESRIALTSVHRETMMIKIMNQRYFQNKKRRKRLLRRVV